MNTYVVAHWSDHNGELLQEVVEAESKVAAVLSYMQWEDTGLTTMEAIESFAANCDCMVSVIDITNSNRKFNLSGSTSGRFSSVNTQGLSALH